jgi:hypothetical protein
MPDYLRHRGPGSVVGIRCRAVVLY